jgi:hypothetical protein
MSEDIVKELDNQFSHLRQIPKVEKLKKLTLKNVKKLHLKSSIYNDPISK